MPDELKPVLARQMEIYAGFLEQTDHEVGRVIDAIDDLGVLDDTLIYYIIGDNGASAEGTLERLLQRDDHAQRHAGHRDHRVPAVQDRRLRHAATPTTTTRSAGRTRCARRTSGPSRSPRTGAAPATARSCTGRTASPTRARPATSSTTSSTSPRPSWRRPGCPRRRSVNGIAQAPLEGVSMLADAARRRRRRRPTTSSTSR